MAARFLSTVLSAHLAWDPSADLSCQTLLLRVLQALIGHRSDFIKMSFEAFEQKMKAEGLSQAAIDAFRLNYEQLTGGATGLVRLSRTQGRCLSGYYGVLRFRSMSLFVLGSVEVRSLCFQSDKTDI